MLKFAQARDEQRPRHIAERGNGLRIANFSPRLVCCPDLLSHNHGAVGYASQGEIGLKLTPSLCVRKLAVISNIPDKIACCVVTGGYVLRYAAKDMSDSLGPPHRIADSGGFVALPLQSYSRRRRSAARVADSEEGRVSGAVAERA